ncbi:MAG: hypothetical protein ACT4O9_03930 [Blastocatellia bacterium]
MKATRKRKRPKDRIVTAIFFAIVAIPFCAMVTFILLYILGGIARDPNRTGFSTRIHLAPEWVERIDWSTAIFLFVVVYVVSQIMSNWDLTQDPPENWLRSKKDDGALSITLKDDDLVNK